MPRRCRGLVVGDKYSKITGKYPLVGTLFAHPGSVLTYIAVGQLLRVMATHLESAVIKKVPLFQRFLCISFRIMTKQQNLDLAIILSKNLYLR